MLLLSICWADEVMTFFHFYRVKNRINIMYKNYFKRAIDFTIVLLALLVIWPFLLVIYIWLTIANKGAGAIFYQERPG